MEWADNMTWNMFSFVAYEIILEIIKNHEIAMY